MRLLPSLLILLLVLAVAAICARSCTDLVETWNETVEVRFDEMETRDE